jgi:hypothetical protein
MFVSCRQHGRRKKSAQCAHSSAPGPPIDRSANSPGSPSTRFEFGAIAVSPGEHAGRWTGSSSAPSVARKRTITRASRMSHTPISWASTSVMAACRATGAAGGCRSRRTPTIRASSRAAGKQSKRLSAAPSFAARLRRKALRPHLLGMEAVATDTCDLIGVPWRPWGRYHISVVARREAVARLDEFIGPKT